MANTRMQVFVLGSYMNAHFMAVDRLPVEGESLAARSVRSEHGGKGLNLAVGLQRLGCSVELLLAVGNDASGDALKCWLENEGIPTSLLLRLGDRSGFGVGFVGPTGENFLSTFGGANSLLEPRHVQAVQPKLARSDWVCAQFEVPDAVILQAFQLARAAVVNVKTYLNPSPWRVPDRELLALTDVLVVNVKEASELFKFSDGQVTSPGQWQQSLPGLARNISFNGSLLVVTLGELGCVAVDASGQAWYQPAWRVDQVDATGAGDAFGCGLLWGLAQGLPLDQTLSFANACGALVAAEQGVLAAQPDAARVEAFLVENRLNKQ